MSTPSWMRRAHRWLATTFTLAVAGVFTTWSCGYRESWVSFVVLLPFACLMVSGLYLLVAPYMATRRTAGGPAT